MFILYHQYVHFVSAGTSVFILCHQYVHFVSPGTIVFMAIPLFEDTGFFSFSLPNSVNMAFYFPYLLTIYPLFLAGGEYMSAGLRIHASVN